MPLIISPGQFTQRAEFYQQLGQLTGAGLGVIRALEQLHKHPPSRNYRQPIKRLLDELAGGYTFTESCIRLGQWLPAFDIALLHAGEQSGRLEACFRLLADYYRDRARLARQMIADLAYPAGLFHMAIFIFPFVEFFKTGNWLAYLFQTFGVLLPVLIADIYLSARHKKPVGFYVNQFTLAYPWFAALLAVVFGAMIAHFFINIAYA